MTDFSLEIDSLNPHAGWLNCWIIVDGQRNPIDASAVFSPFCHLLALTRAITFNQPYSFSWDSEGFGLDFEVIPVETEHPDIRLVVKPFNYSVVTGDEPDLTVDAIFSRKQLAITLLETLRNFSLDCPTAANEWNFPYFLIETFEQELAQGSMMPAGENIPCQVHFVFPTGNFEHYHPPYFEIWTGYELAQHVPMGDIPRFWYGWFEIFEKVKNGEFPFETVFHVESEDQNDENQPSFVMNILGLDVSSRVLCEDGQSPQDFRMKITHQLIDLNTEQTGFHLTFDRRQFVTEFVNSFKAFLEMDYPAFLESGECLFDLRTLPLERLIS